MRCIVPSSYSRENGGSLRSRHLSSSWWQEGAGIRLSTDSCLSGSEALVTIPTGLPGSPPTPKLQSTFVRAHRQAERQGRQQKDCKVGLNLPLSPAGGLPGPGRATVPSHRVLPPPPVQGYMSLQTSVSPTGNNPVCHLRSCDFRPQETSGTQTWA